MNPGSLESDGNKVSNLSCLLAVIRLFVLLFSLYPVLCRLLYSVPSLRLIPSITGLIAHPEMKITLSLASTMSWSLIIC
jgi:hypothetical protein